MYSKIDQWNALSADFAGLEKDEELLITLGDRQYVVKLAGVEDIERHFPSDDSQTQK